MPPYRVSVTVKVESGPNETVVTLQQESFVAADLARLRSKARYVGDAVMGEAMYDVEKHWWEAMRQISQPALGSGEQVCPT